MCGHYGVNSETDWLLMISKESNTKRLRERRESVKRIYIMHTEEEEEGPPTAAKNARWDGKMLASVCIFHRGCWERERKKASYTYYIPPFDFA